MASCVMIGQHDSSEDVLCYSRLNTSHVIEKRLSVVTSLRDEKKGESKVSENWHKRTAESLDY